VKKVKEVVKSRVSEFSELGEEGTNPGVVFVEEQNSGLGKGEIGVLKRFYEDAVREVLTLEDACEVISELRLDCFGLKNRRGLIGALAAASFLVLQRSQKTRSQKTGLCDCDYDFTYELVAYRRRERWGTRRIIDEASVWRAAAATYPLVWDTVDTANKQVVFAPHSPCPVLFGLRGDSVEAIYKAYELIQPNAEPVERAELFVTNQGTDFHLIDTRKKREEKLELQDDRSYILDGVVCSNPRTIKGGHTVFSLSLSLPAGSEEEKLECIAYEPTKGFRAVVRQLRVGDEVTVYGSLKKGAVNLEKLEVRKLNLLEVRNPRCERCGKAMKSAGRSQGYRCKRCGTFCAEKEVKEEERGVLKGFYEVPPVARRHISKPLVRTRPSK